MPGYKVRQILSQPVYDVYIDARPIDPSIKGVSSTFGEQNAKLDHFNSAGNQRLKRLFYTSREIWIPLHWFSPKLRLSRFTYRLGWPIKVRV
jgi:hypothetical protein